MRFFANKIFWQKMAAYAADSTSTLAAFFNTPDVGLFTNDVLLAPQLALTDLTEPTFAGYAPQALTLIWGTQYNGPAGTIIVPAQEILIFQVTADGPTEVIRGFYMHKAASGALAVVVYDNTITVELEDDAVQVVPQMAFVGNVVTM